ncbi:MAG: hypothetical protein JXR73_03225 [Candidatus Omnitrophica bacterium]|nr:hypothetical protein [Candidatus Omnitrophota bacterium]
MKEGRRFTIILLLILGTALSVSGQATVNVSPGDDIHAAIQQAGAGGIVIFAPGEYDVMRADPGNDSAFIISPELEGITLQGAGPGMDPTTASILNGEAWYISNNCFRIQASDVLIDGFTVINFADEGMDINADVFNVEFRNLWIVGCESGVDTSTSSAGFYDDGAPDDFSEMIRFRNCIFARGGDDATDIEDNNTFAFINCDFYDWDSDIMENEDLSTVIVVNCIIHAGEHSDDFDSGGAGGLLEARNCIFFDPPGEDADGLGGIAFEGGAYELDSIGEDPLYVNVGPHVPLEELDFHLRPDSPALTVGKDENGNPTYAGSMGPAQ